MGETAELLGVGRSTAYDLVARGELPALRIGRRIVVTRAALEELLGGVLPSPAELEAARSRQVTDPDPSAPSTVTDSTPASADEPRIDPSQVLPSACAGTVSSDATALIPEPRLFDEAPA